MIPPTRYGRLARRVEGSAFAAGDDHRPLKLVLDDDTLTPDDVALLSAFSDYPEIELWRTAADALPRLEIGDAFEGLGGGSLTINTTGPGRANGIFGVYGTDRLRLRAAQIAAAGAITADGAFNGLVFAAASDESDGDALVTRHQFLLDDDDLRAPIAVDPEGALALIGLALRVHGNEAIGADRADLQLRGRTFHFILARDVLRAGWIWFSGCVLGSHAAGDDTLLYLGQTTLERFQRVLQIRDRLHAVAKQEPTRGRGDDVLFELETLLLFLSAAFDAAARVAHVVYLTGDYDEAGWRRPAWRTRLERDAPNLAALVADGTPTTTLLQIIGALRNTIHGEALRSIQAREPTGLTAQLVGVQRTDAEKLAERIVALGDDPTRWGVRADDQRSTLAADRFVEALLPRAVDRLNDLMQATRTEQLPGIDPNALRGPPGDVPTGDRWWNEMFSWEIRSRVRELGGL